MRVLVCGDRCWENEGVVFARLCKLKAGTFIIHGNALGADLVADDVARVLCLPVKPFPALWGVYGKAAGPRRNREMLDQKPDLVIAFHNDLSKSKGTADTVREARKRGIPVEVIKEGQ